jgi:hypothetical protein
VRTIVWTLCVHDVEPSQEQSDSISVSISICFTNTISIYSRGISNSILITHSATTSRVNLPFNIKHHGQSNRRDQLETKSSN